MVCVAGSRGGLFNYFCAVYRTSHQRRKANRQEAADQEEPKMCPLAHDFDLQIHYAIANMYPKTGVLAFSQNFCLPFSVNKSTDQPWSL